MTAPTPPFAALDAILARTRHLLLDFDGVICHLYAGQPTSAAADRVRTVLTAHGTQLPLELVTTNDPLAVLTFAASIDRDIVEQAPLQGRRAPGG
jgi:hypothetical protein